MSTCTELTVEEIQRLEYEMMLEKANEYSQAMKDARGENEN